MNIPNVISNSLMVGGQLPLDNKVIVPRESDLLDLGPQNYKAFLYYKGLTVYCVDTENTYRWNDSGNGKKLLQDDFVYPLGTPDVNDVIYSNVSFNFYRISNSGITFWNNESFYNEGDLVLHEIDCRLYLFRANKDNAECEPEIVCKDCNIEPDEFWNTEEENIEDVVVIPVKAGSTIDPVQLITDKFFVLLDVNKSTLFKSDVTSLTYTKAEIEYTIARSENVKVGFFTDEVPTEPVSLSEFLVYSNIDGVPVKTPLNDLVEDIVLSDQLIFFDGIKNDIKTSLILNDQAEFLLYPGEEEDYCWKVISGGCAAEDFILQEDIPYSLTNGKSLGRLVGSGIYPAIGKTIEEVVRDIAFEYLLPSFTSFGITQTTPIEVGVAISGNKNFTFAFQYPENIEDNSISIIDVTDSNTVIGSDLSKTSPVTANIGSISKTAVASHQWRATAVNTQSNTIQSVLATVNWQFRYFRGVVATIPANGSALRTAMLSDSIVSNANTFSFTTGTTLKDFVIAIPSHKTLVEAKNMGTNENLPFVLSGTIITVPDAGGTPRDYKVYTLSNAVPFSSNYNINVTLS